MRWCTGIKRAAMVCGAAALCLVAATTGPVADLLGLAVLALALMCAGLVLTAAVIRVDRAYWSAPGDTIDP